MSDASARGYTGSAGTETGIRPHLPVDVSEGAGALTTWQGMPPFETWRHVQRPKVEAQQFDGQRGSEVTRGHPPMHPPS